MYHRIFRWDGNAGQWENVFGLFKQVSAGKTVYSDLKVNWTQVLQIAIKFES